VRKMAEDNRLALSPMYRHTPKMSSIYESTHPWRGSGRMTAAGRAGENGVSSGRIDGDGMEAGWGVGVWLTSGDQCGLLVMSFATSVINSMIMHHSAGLKDPPNFSLK